MKRKKLFIINGAGLAIVNILLRFIAVSFNAYISEKIGTESMGLFTLVMSVYGLAVVFACSGVNLASVRLSSEKTAILEKKRSIKREYSKCASSVIRSCVLYSLLFSLISSSVLFVFSTLIGGKLLGDSRCVTSLKIVAVSLPAISVTSALSGYFTGVRKAYKNAVSFISEQFLKITVTSALLSLSVPFGADPVEYACVAVVGGSAAAEAISLFVNLFLYISDSKIPAGVKPGENESYECERIRANIKEASGISLPTAIGSYARSGLVTAEHLLIPRGLRKNGLNASAALSAYGIIQGMVFPLILFPSALPASFSSLLIPEIAGYFATGDVEKIRRAGNKALSASIFFSVCTSAVFLNFAKELGMNLYGQKEAIEGIIIMAPLIPVMYLDSTVDALLKGLGAQLDSMKINIVDAASSLVLVFFLVPIFGIYGYLITVYFCEILNFVLSFSCLVRKTGFKPSVVPSVFRSGLSALISSFIIFFVKKLPIFSSLSSPVMIVLFISVYFLSNIILSGGNNFRLRKVFLRDKIRY
ncbi:MAG: polysaccharide biosynthesis C-terminal domain-containing protein [Clostridia bacterium]|nr:polysaccharide biosynthesis C-terminal domain-containing protein [Clostridia bacterium]